MKFIWAKGLSSFVANETRRGRRKEVLREMSFLIVNGKCGAFSINGEVYLKKTFSPHLLEIMNVCIRRVLIKRSRQFIYLFCMKYYVVCTDNVLYIN